MSTIEVQEPNDASVDVEKQEQQNQEGLEHKETDTHEEGEQEQQTGDGAGEEDEEDEEENGEESEKQTDEERADETKTIDDSLKQTKKSVEDAAKTLSDKGIDYNALTKEYEEKGELSADTYKKLADAGYPKTVVDTYIRGIEAANEGYAQAIYAAAGGKDEYAKLSSYVASKGQEAVDAFNDAVMNGSVATMKMLISGLQAEMKVRNGTAKSSLLGKGGSATSVGFANEAAMEKAMDDPRYGVDEDYTASVTKRLAKSKFIHFGR